MDSQITYDLLWFGILLLAGVAATKLSSRVGVPALVLFIAVGMILGGDITGLLPFDDARIAQFVGTAALVIILFEGGLQTDWRELRQALWPSVSLATIGVVLTAVLTGFVALTLRELDVLTAMLLASIIGSTDAAAVFAVIGRLQVRRRMKVTVESESAMNDPMAVLLTVFLIRWIMAGPPSAGEAVVFLVWQMGFGLAAGIGSGWLAVRALRRLRYEASGLYPIFVIAMAFVSWAVTTALNGSGFVAVFVLGVFLGHHELPYKNSIIRFNAGIAWLGQIVMFTMLGLLVNPSQLPYVAGAGLLIAAAQMFVTRPIAVWLSTLGMRYPLREKVWIAWGGLRGAVPIVLATYPLMAGVPHSDLIFNVVFFVVLLSALLQGGTIKALAVRLGLVEGVAPPQTVKLELLAMEELEVDMVGVSLPDGARAVGSRLADCDLPESMTVSAILRDGKIVTPRGMTRLQAGDYLFVLAPKEESHRLGELFAGGAPSATQPPSG